MHVLQSQSVHVLLSEYRLVVWSCSWAAIALRVLSSGFRADLTSKSHHLSCRNTTSEKSMHTSHIKVTFFKNQRPLSHKTIFRTHDFWLEINSMRQNVYPSHVFLTLLLHKTIFRSHDVWLGVNSKRQKVHPSHIFLIFSSSDSHSFLTWTV